MVGRRLHDLKPVNHLENLGHIDHCACFPRTQSQRKFVEGAILTLPPTELTHAVVYCFTTFSGPEKSASAFPPSAPCESSQGCLQMDPRLEQSCWFRPIWAYLGHSTGATTIAFNPCPTGKNKRNQKPFRTTLDILRAE